MKLVNFKTGVVLALILVVLAGCAKPAMPITVTYRESLIGEGYVVQFRNETEKHLSVRVQFKNRTLDVEKDGYIDLSPNGTTEIGWMEGWKFVSGETIILEHENYATARHSIP